ncbi:transcriptional regulator with XRE-family HTH domain [Pelomonas aquatica]|uniref:Transcriptional regulator with XRE-family HTH domain n=1 Tax=Pelomonas aquatica TaxID=431058 RepID=A0ABU1ZC27_9BURK|nr:helix-turn-helix transcriptional regulator [Pelomonas aquatica]MDR7297540.1 transcriptional regulator with XRE-family HTH domain [Pelomonas aquatica]
MDSTSDHASSSSSDGRRLAEAMGPAFGPMDSVKPGSHADGRVTLPRGLDASRFGERLIAAMQLRGNFKATALACALAVNEAAISRWKRGGPITLHHAIRLCDTLDISMDWLIRGIGHPAVHHRPDGGQPPPLVSERTVDEVRALLSFIERRTEIRLAQDASGQSCGARAT